MPELHGSSPSLDRRAAERTGAGAPGADWLYRLLVESVSDYAIFALDAKGRVMSWNPGAARFKGYAPDEILGRHFSTFYPSDDVAAGKPDWELEVAARDGRFEDEGWRLRKDGSRFWANVVITALRTPNGELVGFGKVTRDLTARREAEARARELAAAEASRAAAEERAIELARLAAQLEEQAGELEAQTEEAQALAEALEQSNAALEAALQATETARADAVAANAAKAQFLATMSHELRTPLNAIAGYAELLEMGLRGPLTDEQRHDIGRIRRSEGHLRALIEEILSYARLEAGHTTFELTSLAARELAVELVPLVAPQAQAKGVTLSLDDGGHGALVRADADRVRQILLNLLSNAIKFTPAGGRIVVSVAAEGDRVAFHVRDNGVGIAPDKLAAIFEPFVQLGRSLSESQEGVGLGLAISRELARGMSGELGVTSAVGVGSTFTLWLPRG